MNVGVFKTRFRDWWHGTQTPPNGRRAAPIAKPGNGDLVPGNGAEQSDIEPPRTREDGTATPYQRATTRTSVPALKVEIAGQKFVTVDWSIGGCRIGNYQGSLRPRDETKLTLYLNVASLSQKGITVSAEMVRIGDDESAAFRFINLDVQDIKYLCEMLESEMNKGEQ